MGFRPLHIAATVPVASAAVVAAPISWNQYVNDLVVHSSLPLAGVSVYDCSDGCFLAFMSPFSSPSRIIRLILCFGYAQCVHFSSPSGHITEAYSLGNNSPFLFNHSWFSIPNCSSSCLEVSHTSSAPSSTSRIVSRTVAMISALRILSISLHPPECQRQRLVRHHHFILVAVLLLEFIPRNTLEILLRL